MQVRLQYEPAPREFHVVHHANRRVRGEVRGGGGATQRGGLPSERVLVPNREPAVCQPRQRRRRVRRHHVLKIVQRREQRPSDVSTNLPRGVGQSARHGVEHHASHTLLGDPRAQSVAGGYEPSTEFPRHRRPIPRLSAV